MLLLFKCASHRNKSPFVSTADEGLVGTIMTIGDVNDIYAIGNHMISSAIWNKHECNFFNDEQNYGLVQFVIFERMYKCLYIPSCTKKVMRLLINDMYAKISPLFALNSSICTNFTFLHLVWD